MRQYDFKIKGREIGLQYVILRYLHIKGCIAGKTKTMGVKRGNVYCKDKLAFHGFPDLTAFIPKGSGYQLIFIEVKATTKQTQEQKSFQQYCALAKIPYILAKRIEDVEVLFE